MTDDEDDDFDFGSSSTLLNQEPKRSKLINLGDLEGQSLTVIGFHDIKNRYSPFVFKKRYYIHDLKHVEYADLMEEDYEILGIWDNKFDEDEVREKMVWYKGKILFSGIEMSVLVTFKNLNDILSVVILEIDQESKTCNEVTIDKGQNRIVSQYQLNESFYKIKKIKLSFFSFYDVDNYWDVRI